MIAFLILGCFGDTPNWLSSTGSFVLASGLRFFVGSTPFDSAGLLWVDRRDLENGSPTAGSQHTGSAVCRSASRLLCNLADGQKDYNRPQPMIDTAMGVYRVTHLCAGIWMRGSCGSCTVAFSSESEVLEALASSKINFADALFSPARSC